MSMTFKAGDATIHRIIEMEVGFTRRWSSAEPDKDVLDENRSWMHPAALDANDNGTLLPVICREGGKHNILIDSCVGNDKDRPARPLWHKKKDDAFMRGLAAAGLTVTISISFCARIFTSIYRLEHALENGAGYRPFSQRPLHLLQDGARLLARAGEEDRPAQIVDSVIPIVEAKACDVVTSDHSLNDLITLIRRLATPSTIRRHPRQRRQGRGLHGDLIHTRSRRCIQIVDARRLQSRARRRLRTRFPGDVLRHQHLCCFAHFPSPSKGYVKRWGNGFKCDYVS